MATPAIHFRKKTRRLILTVLALLTGGVVVGLAVDGYGIVGPFRSSSDQAPTAADKLPPNRVEALGRLEPEGGMVNIGVGVPMGDRLSSVFVKEGQEVTKDQELARLESYEIRRAERDLAASQLAEARDRLAAVTANGNCQIEEAKIRIRQIEEIEPLDIRAQTSKVELLRDQLGRARQNLQRMQRLKQDTISRQEMEQHELLVHQAEVELSSAEALLEKTTKAHKLSLQSAQAQLKTLETSLARFQKEIPIPSLEKGLQVAEERLKHTRIHAPTQGRILKVLGHAGETVGSQPILRMADLSHMLALAEVYETEVGRIRVGQRATVRSPALSPAELSGKVVHIGRLIDRNYIFDLDPRADTDRRVVAVKIQLDNSEPAAHFVNLQVTVTIHVDAAAQGGTP
jgi:HlyD family secretion protein